MSGLTTTQIVVLGGVSLFIILLCLLVGFSIYSCRRAKREDKQGLVEAVGKWKQGGAGTLDVPRIPKAMAQVERAIPPVPPIPAARRPEPSRTQRGPPVPPKESRREYTKRGGPRR